MSNTFTCPHCATVSEIDPAHVGKTGPCRSCGKQVTVPLPKESALPPTTAPARGSATPWIIGCAVVAVLLVLGGLVLCGGVAFLGVRTNQQIQQELIRVEAEVQRAQEEAIKAQQEAAREINDRAAESGQPDPPVAPSAPVPPEGSPPP